MIFMRRFLSVRGSANGVGDILSSGAAVLILRLDCMLSFWQDVQAIQDPQAAFFPRGVR
jgi:hypothetical protein